MWEVITISSGFPSSARLFTSRSCFLYIFQYPCPSSCISALQHLRQLLPRYSHQAEGFCILLHRTDESLPDKPFRYPRISSSLSHNIFSYSQSCRNDHLLEHLCRCRNCIFCNVFSSSNCFKNLKCSTNGCAFAFTLSCQVSIFYCCHLCIELYAGSWSAHDRRLQIPT